VNFNAQIFINMPETDILNACAIQYYPELVYLRFSQFVHTVAFVRNDFRNKIFIKQLSNYFLQDTNVWKVSFPNCLLSSCFYTLPLNVASV
jgi:hypothetical protein